jgi:hypothetical protein
MSVSLYTLLAAMSCTTGLLGLRLVWVTSRLKRDVALDLGEDEE